MKRFAIVLVASGLVLNACSGTKAIEVDPIFSSSSAIPDTVEPVIPQESPLPEMLSPKSSDGSGAPSADPAGEPSKDNDAGDAPAVSVAEKPSGVIVDAIDSELPGRISVVEPGSQGVVAIVKPEVAQKASPIHVFAVRKFQRGLGDWGKSLIHISPDSAGAGGLWGAAHTAQYIPAPEVGGKWLDLNESPAVARTETGFHIVSRSGDKLLYWQCDQSMACQAKVINDGDDRKVQGCVVITSDPFGRVYIFAKHNPSGRLEMYQGTGAGDMHAAGHLFSDADIQACPAAAYHPQMKRVYVFSSHDGNLIAGVSGKIESASQSVTFQQVSKTLERKLSGGMASCGENGRLTVLYNEKTQRMSVLHHENGGSNTVIQSSGFEDAQTGFGSGPLFQKALSSYADDSDNIDDYPVGLYDDLGTLHAFADKAYSNGVYEVTKTSAGALSSVIGGDGQTLPEVERAPAAVFEPAGKAIHLFARSVNDPLTHFVKKRQADGSWSSWQAELLVDDGAHDFEGCPVALIGN